MTQPIINIYRTTEEAFYFDNSQMNRFYSFNGVQLLPFNTRKYIQVTNTPDGIDLEDWTVFAVDMCSGVKTDITESFMVESLTNSEDGAPQLFWSLENVQHDFGMNLIYLEVGQSLGETFYSTPFLLTNEESEKTTQFHYKSKRNDNYQSVGFQVWFRQNTKQTELTTYYEASTKRTVTQAVKTNKIAKYVSEIMDIDQIISLTDVLENPYLYVDGTRASLFEAVEVPEVTSQENFSSVKFNVSLFEGDLIDLDALIYVPPFVNKPVAINDVFTVDNTGNSTLLVLSNDNLGVPPTNIIYLIQSNITTGTLSIASGGQSITFTPNGNLAENQQFTYRIEDSNRNSSQAYGFLTVQAEVPVLEAVNDSVLLANSGVSNIYPMGNDSLGLVPTTITSINTSGFTLGTVAIASGGGSLTFTPNGVISAEGQSITYTITDSTGATDSAFVLIKTKSSVVPVRDVIFSDGTFLTETDVIEGTVQIIGDDAYFRCYATSARGSEVDVTLNIDGNIRTVSRTGGTNGTSYSTGFTLSPGTYDYYFSADILPVGSAGIEYSQDV